MIALIERTCLACMAGLVLAAPPMLAQNVTLEEMWVYPGEPIPWLAGMAVVEGGYWALDALHRTTFFISEDSAAATEVTLPGAESPVLLGGGGRGIAVYDEGGGSGKILVYRDGGLRTSFPLRETVYFPKDVLAVDDSTVILAAGLSGSGFGLHILRRGGRKSAHLLPLQPTRQSLVARMITGGMLALDGDGVLFARSAPHLIARLDPVTATLDTIASFPAILPSVGDDFLRGRSQNGGGSPRWFFPQARGLERLQDGAIVHVIRSQETGTSIWEVYDRDGNLVVRSEMGRAYDVWAVLDDGTILASYYVGGPRSLPVRLKLKVEG